MSIPSSLTPLFNSGSSGGLQIERSLRFNPVDTPYLRRVFSGNGSNMKIRTFSCWVKRSGLGVIKEIFSNYGTAGHTRLNFETDTLYAEVAGALLQTTQVFRDVSAWYHILFAWDTTQATSSNRSKLYVNGTQITTFSTEVYPTQNADTNFATTDGNSIIGQYQNMGGYVIDGYLANIHFIDGQQLTPSSFTETDATTGQLIPKTYTGSYGTNGFNLLFADNSSNTASTLGKDTSGNSNNWTPNYLSVTAGAGNDSLVDSPTNYGTDTGVGGEVRGNYCTLNPLKMGSFTLSNGNLDCVSTSSYALVLGTIGMSSGKWYFETTLNGSGAANAIGIAADAATITQYPGYDSLSWTYLADGRKINGGSRTSYGASFTTGDVIGVVFDADAGSLTFYKNGSSQGTAFTGLTSGPYFPCVGDDSSGSQAEQSLNFGQRAFAYQTPGTNRPAATFLALCTQNLPAPLVTKPSTVFDVVTYTGTGSSLTLPNGSSTPTSIAFTPDFVWLKGRSGATSHALYDAVRGVQKDLVSNSTSAETTETTGLTAFGTNTLTVGSLAKLNTSAATYAAWCWDAGTSTVSNPDGSITSQVRANPSAGFSVATLTTPGSGTFTVGHGLNVAPSLVICKARNQTFTWIVYHRSAGAGNFLVLNTTAASAASATVWQNTDPSSTVVYGDATNWGTADYVMYSFAPVVGYSSFGSYTGNGSADGPFIFTSFRPRWVMLKASSSTGDWYILDTSRDTYNLSGKSIPANLSIAEPSIGFSYSCTLDLLSNGFKFRDGGSGSNGSGVTYIYAAFAEAPFNYSRGR